MNEKFSSSRRLVLAVLALVFFFSPYFAFYLQCIPYEQTAGITGWIQAVKMSWHEILGCLFNPVTERSMATNALLSKVRVTESVILKILYFFFDDSLKAVMWYNVAVALVLGLLVLSFVYKYTTSALAGFLCAAFLLTTAAYGWTIMEYGDFCPSDQIFLLCYLLIFLGQLDKLLKLPAEKMNFQRLMYLALLWCVGMMAIRAKEPSRYLVPGLSWLMIFCSYPQRRRRGFFPLCMVTALLTLPLVLVKDSTSEFHGIDLTKALHWFFYNPNGWEPQHSSCLFSLHRSLPVSVLSNLGFFLCWATVLSIARLIYVRTKKSTFQSAPAPTFSIAFFLTAWTLVGIAFHTVIQNDVYTRNMVWSLLPFSMLIAVILTRFTFSFSGKTKILVAAILVPLGLIKIADNTLHSIYMRQELESIWVPKAAFLAEVYKDATGSKDERTFNINQYWWPGTAFTHAVDPYIYPREWKDLAQDKEFADILKKYGKAYIASTRLLKLPWPAVMLKDMDGSKLSILTSIKAKITHPTPKHYYLYRVTNP